MTTSPLAPESDESGPFVGYTVVEFGQYVAVPYAGQLLAEGGARVIKVEPFGGDAYRRLRDRRPGADRQFQNKNRAKESLALDLGQPDAERIVRRLVAAADVVLINMSPSAVARRGLDYETFRAINPRIVYGIVSAYGNTGDYARLPGMDIVVQAWSGLLNAFGAEEHGLPKASEVPAIDHATALLLLNGILAALLARHRTGRGQRVDVSLLAGALTLQNKELVHYYGVDSWRTEFTDSVLPRLRREGASPAEIAAVRSRMRPDLGGQSAAFHAHFRIFRTADGFVSLGAGSLPARRRLFELLGVDETLLETDPHGVTEKLVAILGAAPTAHWVRLLGDGGVPIGEVRHVEEMLFDPHIEEEGLMVDIDDPVAGRYRILNVPISLSDTPWEATRPAPVYAADTRAVLADIGFSDAEIDDLFEGGSVDRPIAATDGERAGVDAAGMAAANVEGASE